jgi:vanillate O-demethylase ferredoxin subunit
MGSLPVLVADVTIETSQIRALRLVREDGKDLGPYRAGAHIDVTGPTGIVRQYSLCGPPSDPRVFVIAVKREPASRGGSAALHEVQPGDRLFVSEPRNLLSIATGDRHLLVAGGIGVTPLLSMAYELQSQAADFELHYFASAQEDIAFRALLVERGEFADHFHLHCGLTRDEQSRTIEAVRPTLTSDSAVYVCGPQPFMQRVADILSPVVGEARIYIEHFTPTEADNSKNLGFTVELSTGETFEIPANRSILSVLEENGIEVFKSCEEGICGSCVSGLLEGLPDHRDQCLSTADHVAGDRIALCVSRALTDHLVIELD